jgi:hypothetical protein
MTERDPAAAGTLQEAKRTVGWGLAFWGGAQLAMALLPQNATALAALQAAIAEWGAGRIGVAWTDPLGPSPTGSGIARRAGRGAALGAAAVVLVVLVALATGRAAMAGWRPSGGLLAVGLVVAILESVRDELFLRGVVLRATRGMWPAWAALVACGAAAGAARFGLDGAIGLGLLVESLRGVALGALWVKDRGAWMAVAANATWKWGLGSVIGGGLVDIRFATSATAGMPALVAVAAGVAGVAAAAVWALPRRPLP